jgi:sRNA-binding regulator protein Hfq
MTTREVFAVSAVCAMGLLAHADTLYVKNGPALDGKVVRLNDHAVALESGNGRMVFQNHEIERIEKNEKKGTLDYSAANPIALEHERQLEKRTGLTAKQREEIIALVDQLAKEDSEERKLVVKRLVTLQQKIDVFRFLNESRGGFGARLLPGVLEVMTQIDKSATKPIVLECATDKVAGIRAAAITLMGKVQGYGSVEMIARGLVDEDVDVRVAAAAALADVRDKRATPALIAGMSDNNQRVVNVCKASLSRLWSTENAVVQYETAAEWAAFWQERAPGVSKPIQTAALQPLSVTEPGSYVIVHE